MSNVNDLPQHKGVRRMTLLPSLPQQSARLVLAPAADAASDSSSAGQGRKRRKAAGGPAQAEELPINLESKERQPSLFDSRQLGASYRSLAATLPPEVLTVIIKTLIRGGTELDCLSTLLVNKAWFNATIRLLWRRPPLRQCTFASFVRAMRRGGSSNPTAIPRRILRSAPTPFVYGPFVRELFLSEMQDAVNDKVLASISTLCPNLRVINIERCRCVSPLGVGKLVRYCESLEQMDLTGIRAVDDRTLKRMFPVQATRLKNLSITLSHLVTGDGLLQTLKKMAKLERIWVQHCSMLTDEYAQEVLQSCPKLTDVSLLDCRVLTGETIRSISTSIGARLTQLTLGVSDYIRDDDILVLARACPNLTGLTLALLRHITDASLFAIASHLAKLAELGIFSSQHITNTGVQRIAGRCVNLERLCLYDCRALTAEAFVAVELGLPKLDYLNIEQCRVPEATPELRRLWKRCRDFYACRPLLNALHIADLMEHATKCHGFARPLQMTLEIV
ncbi:SCF ubiquitin ligase complex subunit [Geranomyces michiganensis]|nr:SCF ubiquitin ligase complex subunit [Geranomyces michiganensis]